MRPVALAVLLAVWAVSLSAAEAPAQKAPPKADAPKEEKLPPGTYARVKTAKGEIMFRLLADAAPKTVANFVELAKGERPWKDKDGRWVAKPFYNGLTFYRVENDTLKLIQAGCPKGDGTGGPGYKLEDETPKDLKFDKPGVVGMEKAGSDAHGSQFFITLAPAPSLDGKFTIFGQVVRGLEVAEAISRMPSTAKGAGTDAIHLAKDPVAIQSVTIEVVKEEPKGDGK